jgi:hypothetical protein
MQPDTIGAAGKSWIMSVRVDPALQTIGVATLALLLSAGGVFAQASAPASWPTSKAAAPATPSADQILDKYVQASGGRAAWQKLHSRVSKGTVDVPAASASGTVEVREKAPDRVLITVNIAGTVFTQGFDGTVGWSNDPQNGVREQTGPELAETKRDADFYHALDFRKLYPKISVAGTDKVGDKSAYVIEATPAEGGDPDKVYFDAQTGLLVRAVTQHHNPDGSVEPFQEDFEDYRTQDGVTIPFTIHQTNPQMSFTIKIDEVRHNVELDDAEFHKPAAQ